MWCGPAAFIQLPIAAQLLQLYLNVTGGNWLNRIRQNPHTGWVIQKGVIICLTWSHCSLLASRTVLSFQGRWSSLAEDWGRVAGWGEGWGSGKAGWWKTEGCGDSADCWGVRRTLSGNAAGRWYYEVLGCKLGSNVFPWRGLLRFWSSLEQV